MNVVFTPFRFLTRGFGGPAAAILAGGLLTFPIIIDEIRQVVGRSKGRDQFEFNDDIEVYKISAMLVSINAQPLNNKLYNKMTKMIFEKKINVNVNLLESTAKKSDQFKIVIGEHKIKRGYDE